MLIRVDEKLPDDPLQSEVVLHVRRHLRAAIRQRAATMADDLAHFFGFARAAGKDDDWARAAHAPQPTEAGAVVAAQRRGGAIATLGHDLVHVEECRRWLLYRKNLDDAFAAIKASDLATLLELSKARDFACARGVDANGGERFLPLLIEGATGTGKELLAVAIHRLWARALERPDAPFEVIQVGGMSPDMVNDELFGHARGAFTGAITLRQGRLELADKGTLLIDEVGDLPREAQLRLLRFLQTQKVSRIGENTERQLSVRILAATWHNLDADVAAGTFRLDLLHRLRVGSGLGLVSLPLRERFFDEVLPEMLTERHHTSVPPITRSARDALAFYAWPGNLRELGGVLDAAIALAGQDTLRVEHLPSHIQRSYLDLPLPNRALGFLLDEVEGQSLDDEHLNWRMSELTASLDQIPPPPPNEELATVGQFLTLLDDSSEEHGRSVADVQRLVLLDQKSRHAFHVSQFWGQVLSQCPPGPLRSLVRQAQSEAQRAQGASDRESADVRKRATIESNPWLRLLNEIHGLPLLRGANTGDLGKAFLAAFNLIKLVAPSFIDEVREDARVGGFNKLRERALAALREKQEPEATDGGFAPLPAARRTKDDWKEIAACPTQRAAVEATGYDPKTIAKYLKKHRIKNPWKA